MYVILKKNQKNKEIIVKLTELQEISLCKTFKIFPKSNSVLFLLHLQIHMLHMLASHIKTVFCLVFLLILQCKIS